ncbi:hypothetical protein BX257_9169 [Streptomyces sp. 3212.3]|uniref:hypothetical protein n=1 Tax=Streptomyces sp. 3212.3 TaxID=1938846 RepID=UPI000E3868FF|nr:hypothetical protein [Streptomyces sp. 3212.3]REE66337.1 hypothetical protein BX257_9169 [Streptomyces sp. 3212.3]
MTATMSPGGQFLERTRAVINVLGPATVVTSLLFYFGYVATTARFRYFGVYLSLMNQSLQDMMLYGVEALYPPLIAVSIVGLLALAVHTGVRLLLVSEAKDDITGWIGVFVTLLGCLALARGVVGMLVPHISRTETVALTPLCLGVGAVGLTYGSWLLRRITIRRDRRRFRNAPEDADPPTRSAVADWLASTACIRLCRYAIAWTTLLVIASAFWTANSFAAAYGLGRALDDADSLPRRPEIVLYTKEPLRDLPAGASGTRLTPSAGSQLQYRYRGLRLLVQANDHLFLVPAHWTTPGGRTLVVPYDNTVHLELVPS